VNEVVVNFLANQRVPDPRGHSSSPQRFTRFQVQNPVMKLCFVTVGATASFESLLQSVFNETFLSALKQHGYTHLLVQYGKDGQAICENFTKKNPEGSVARHGIDITGLDFNQAGLGAEMRLAQANAELDQEGGMIISHAGTMIPLMRGYIRRVLIEC